MTKFIITVAITFLIIGCGGTSNKTSTIAEILKDSKNISRFWAVERLELE